MGGGFIVINNRPCKVADVTKSKPGKHGHAKYRFMAKDIFNGKKSEYVCPSSHNCDVPDICRNEYQLLDIDLSDPAFLTLMDSSGNTKELPLPKGTEKLEKLSSEIKTAFDEGRDVTLIVTSAMGEEQVQDMRGMAEEKE